MDDILIIYDTTCAAPDSIQNYINHIHSSLQFSPTYEDNAQINFLDLHIIKKKNQSGN